MASLISWQAGSEGETSRYGGAGLPIRSRGEVFAGLALLGSCNGLVLTIYRSIMEHGLSNAVMDTFGVSAFVWIAIVAVPALMLTAQAREMTKLDNWVAGAALILFVFPLSHLSWVGLTGLALYLIYGPRVGSVPADPILRRGAIILLATTTAMFWGRLFLQNSGSSILALDAAGASFLTGMGHISNVVETADGGHLWIAPYCSSWSNISLAVLCSALVVQWYGLAWTRLQAVRCALAIVLVVIINDVRIGVMVLRPDLYDAVHGGTGATLANMLTVGVIAAAILWRNERGQPSAR